MKIDVFAILWLISLRRCPIIRHIVFFTVLPENYEDVRAGLAVLVNIPHARCIEIGDNLHFDRWSNEINLVVYGEFDSQKSLNDFKSNQLYQYSISKVRNLRELRFAADYDTNQAIRSTGR